MLLQILCLASNHWTLAESKSPVGISINEWCFLPPIAFIEQCTLLLQNSRAMLLLLLMF